MNKKNQNIFVDNINMETQTVFHASGDINIYPCSFERGRSIVAQGTRASQKGRMVTEDDGTSLFRPYAKDSGARYRKLFQTAHGEVKATKESIIVAFRFPQRMGRTLIEALFGEETAEVKAFIKTRRQDTEWE